MARVVHAVDVEITGELDPSLAKAVGMTETEQGQRGTGQIRQKLIRKRATGQIRGKVKEGENGIGMMDSGSLSSEQARGQQTNREEPGSRVFGETKRDSRLAETAWQRISSRNLSASAEPWLVVWKMNRRSTTLETQW